MTLDTKAWLEGAIELDVACRRGDQGNTPGDIRHDVTMWTFEHVKQYAYALAPLLRDGKLTQEYCDEVVSGIRALEFISSTAGYNRHIAKAAKVEVQRLRLEDDRIDYTREYTPEEMEEQNLDLAGLID